MPKNFNKILFNSSSLIATQLSYRGPLPTRQSLEFARKLGVLIIVSQSSDLDLAVTISWFNIFEFALVAIHAAFI